MRRLHFLIILILLIPFTTRGQSIYSQQQDASWQFKFSNSKKADPYTNMVLKQLALAHLRMPEYTSFTFFFNYGASVGFQQGNLLDISFSLTPSICTGDIVVREFDLQQVLVPAKCSFRISVVNPLRGEVFAVRQENIPLADLLAGSSVAAFPDSLWIAGSKLVIEFNGFGFDEPSFRKVEKELYAIRDYDAAATLADTLEKRIRKARVALHSPRDAFQTYVFCNKGVYLLGEAVKTKTQIVPGNDPRKLLSKVPVVDFQFQDLTGYFLEEGIAGPLTGNVWLNMAQGFSKALSDALTLSQKVDYYSSPFYYRLYSNSTTAGQLADASRAITKFAEFKGLATSNPAMLSRRIAEEYLHMGERLMAEGRYAEAVDLLTSSIRFCSVNPLISTPEKLTSALGRARSGLTASYIRIVQKALDNNLPSLADKYLAEAMQYATKYNNMNAADSAGFAGLYGVLTGKNIQAGNNFLDRQNFQAALAEFDKAAGIAAQFKLDRVLVQAEAGQAKAVDGIYRGLFGQALLALETGNPDKAAGRLKEALDFSDGYPLYTPDPVPIDSLNRHIARATYDALVLKAANQVKEFNYKNAVALLLDATTLGLEHHIPPATLYDSLVTKAGIPQINALFSEGRLKLWAGEPENALSLAGEAMQLVAAFRLTGRPEIKDQYASLMQLADESLCSRVKGELNSIINSADEKYRQNKFDEAGNLVMQARELIYSRAACGLNTIELNKLTGKYQYPVRWNEMVKGASILIAEGDYLKGIEMIQQSGAIFNYYRLDTLGLLNSGLLGLAMATEHIPLIKYAAGHYIARGGFEEAFKLLNRLYNAGVQSEETIELQESIARGLAQRDVAETEMLDLKTMLKVYTGGNKWFRRFAEVYKFHVENK